MPNTLKKTTGTCDSLVTFQLPLPRKRKIWHSLFTCEGVVLLKQWKQGNTGFSKTLKDL